MLKNGVHGGNVELLAASHIYKCNIHVILSNNIHCANDDKAERVFHLLYEGDGYRGHCSACERFQAPTEPIRLRKPVNSKKPITSSKPFKATYKCAMDSIICNFSVISVGELSEQCQHCSAFHFKAERNSLGRYTLCCFDGKIKIPLGKMPSRMIELFTGDDDLAKNFRENIRQYNNAMSFVSFGANITPPPGYGPYCFKIQGMVHHRVSPLYPDNKKDSAYGQLYILDFDEANNIRFSKESNKGFKAEVLTILNEVLYECNPYVKSYKTMHQKISEESASAIVQNRQPKNFVMRFYHEPSSDQRRFNNPTCSEVAAIFESTDGAPPSHRCISVYDKHGAMKNIDYDSMHTDPMCYALLWPHGESGWHISMPTGGSRKTKVRQTVTMREHILYRIAVRGSFNPIINASRLTQQIFVDYYCRMEGIASNSYETSRQNLGLIHMLG